MKSEIIELTIPEEFHLERIDKCLPILLEADLSRSFIQKLIREGCIRVNGAPIKQNYKAKGDDAVIVEIPWPVALELEPEDIPLEIIYEDSSVVVINKQPGLVVHPGSGNYSKTLVNALLYHIKDLSSIGGVERPGIVHRLDKDTSGLMVIAKNDRAHRFLIEEFSGRRVSKEYRAIVIGKPGKGHGIIDRPLGRHPRYRHKMTVDPSGREAVTEYTLKKMWNTGKGLFSMLELKLHTGRTHQIRVHLSIMGNPIVGDPIYSKKWERHRVPYLLLASTGLAFTHPDDGTRKSFSVDIPVHMKEFIDRLEKSETAG